MLKHHAEWLKKHPERNSEWLNAKIQEGFHIHHIDCNHENNLPENLVLLDGIDHFQLHEQYGFGNYLRERIVAGKATTQGQARPIKAEPEASINARIRMLMVQKNCDWAAASNIIKLEKMNLVKSLKKKAKIEKMRCFK